jgi:glycosyltransferase involved in cell wall biosynthesis
MHPLVSIIVPCFNEEETISLTLEAFAGQTYTLTQIEVLVVDGMSTDHTLAKVNDFCVHQPDLNVRVIQNPRRLIPTALNLGIAQARGDYIIRMDAHAVPARDYVARCVELLRHGVADNVGGRWIIVPGADTSLARAIALAVGHPFGAGDALYRYAQQAAYTDTVPFGAFRREVFGRVGNYDEQLSTNEDYELNYRIRQAGGRVYFSPDIMSKYYARSSLRALARQYFRYGWWKVRMLRRHPSSIRLRQLVPPLFVTGVIGFGVGGLFLPFFALSWMMLVICYLTLNSLVALSIAWRHRSWRVGLWLPWVFATIHLSWGSGFCASLPGTWLRKAPK